MIEEFFTTLWLWFLKSPETIKQNQYAKLILFWSGVVALIFLFIKKVILFICWFLLLFRKSDLTKELNKLYKAKYKEYLLSGYNKNEAKALAKKDKSDYECQKILLNKEK